MSLLKKVLKRADRRVVLSTGAVLVIVIAVCATLSWWAVALTALALLQFLLLTVGLGIVPSKGVLPVRSTPSDAAVSDLERRVDLLSTRIVASTERARVEVLDALAHSPHERDSTRR